MRSLISQVSIHKLEVFCTVADLGSVSRAAERLGIVQPAVSSHLKTLADKIGKPLFQQQGRRMRLTEAGQRVHDWAHEIVSRTREMEREMDEGTGSAVVGASMTMGSYVLPELLARFRKSVPDGAITLRIAPPQGVLDALHSGRCDFAFSLMPTEESVNGLDARPVFDEELVLVGPAVPDAIQGPIRPVDLGGLSFITAPSGDARRIVEEELLAHAGIRRMNPVLALEHAEAIKRAVGAGAGYAFVFRSSVLRELRLGELRVIEVEGQRLMAPIFRLMRNGKRLSRFQTRLLEQLTAGLDDGRSDATAES